MVFSSEIFLFAFLPLFLLSYFVAGRTTKLRNIVLLVFSLLFYAWGEPIYVFLMLGSILFNWGMALLVSGCEGGGIKKALLFLSIAANVGILIFFKYETFFALSLNAVIGEGFIAELGVDLPIGISFFTLQAVSYLIDVYRDEVEAQDNPLYLGMYIAMFPQLVAGPIVRYGQVASQIQSRHVTLSSFSRGFRLFIIGLGKKCLLADTCGILASNLLDQPAASLGFVGCLSGALAYAFQIYYDFSGYSDMAIGLGGMMGFRYPRNFNYPYISQDLTEFWRRWHISLGSFFRDYVYIPLGGSRASRPRWMLNIMFVWMLTGVWHGAAWNFVLWGLYYGVLLLIEKTLLANVLSRLPHVARHCYCLVLVTIGWVIFSVTGLENVLEWLFALVGGFGLLGTAGLWDLQSWSYLSLLPILMLGVTPIFPFARIRLQAWIEGGPTPKWEESAPVRGNEALPPCQLEVEAPCSRIRGAIGHVISAALDASLLGLLLVSCASISSGAFSPFIYFQF